jgi:hypothetical protein
MNILKVTHHDNRGTAEEPYGYVYFTDDRRVAYTKEEGVTDDVTGGWDAIYPTHVRLAKKYLGEQGIL